MSYEYIVEKGSSRMRVTEEERATLSGYAIHHIFEVTDEGDRMLSDSEASALLEAQKAPPSLVLVEGGMDLVAAGADHDGTPAEVTFLPNEGAHLPATKPAKAKRK